MQDFESSLTNIVHLVIRSLSIFSNYASSNSTEEIDKLIENGKLILQEVILGMPPSHYCQFCHRSQSF